MRKIAYLDCHSGISGDMFLGAMLDAGFPFELLRDTLATLPISGYELIVKPYDDSSIHGSQFQVRMADQEQPMRHFSDIVNILHESKLPEKICNRAIAIFRTLAEAEATIHATPFDEIHFHEVGALDSIIDITGAAIALDALAIEQVYASPIPLTRGHACMAHGLMPLPAPATLEILRKVKAPWIPYALEGELVTPTGAAILATVARFDPPPFTIEQIGYGFGQKKLAWPNCLRVFLGHEYYRPVSGKNA